MKTPWAKPGHPQMVEVACNSCGHKFVAPKGTAASTCKRCWMYFGYTHGVVSKEEWQAFLRSEEKN